MSRTVHAEVGAELPVLERLCDQPMLVAYAGATWDWNRLHYDAAYCAERKLPAPVVDGQMFGALLAEHAMDGLGSSAYPTSMSFKYRAMVFAGDTVRVTGTISAVGYDGSATVEQTIEATTADGDWRVAVVATTTVRRSR